MEGAFSHAMSSSLRKIEIEYHAITRKVLLFGTIALNSGYISLKKKRNGFIGK